jgi:hypothetical protein
MHKDNGIMDSEVFFFAGAETLGGWEAELLHCIRKETLICISISYIYPMEDYSIC